MTLISRLFTQAPAPNKTTYEQIAELDSQSAEHVTGVALSASDEALRVAAVGKLEWGDALCRLATQEADHAGAVQRAAQQRIAQLLDTNAMTLDQLREHLADRSALLAVTTLASNAQHTQTVIASMSDQAALAKLALDAQSTKVRQLAADAIHDPTALKQLLKDSRGKDKNVHKIVQAKCDALRAQERAAAETQSAIASLCVALERHTHQPFDNLFVPTLEHLEGQWRLVSAQANDDDRPRAEKAIERCHAVIAQHRQAMAQQAARVAAVASADDDRKAVLAQLQALLAEIYEGVAQNIDERLAQRSSRWVEIASYKSPSHDDKANFERLSNAIVTLNRELPQLGGLLHQMESLTAATVQQLKHSLRFMELLGDVAAPHSHAALAKLREWEDARAQEHAAEAAALRQVSGLIGKAQSALKAGHSRQAAGLRHAIEDKMQTLTHVPKHLAAQLQTLDEKLNVLQDWRSYAVAPKRIELIESMEALVGSEEHPNSLAEQIKRLQDEWKLISKGNTEDTSAEWQRFHDAAQKAFEPCREYFAAQAKQRETNLEKRKALLARISAFAKEHDWNAPNWREVSKAVFEATQIWRRHQPVERGPNKPIQEQFDRVIEELQQKLAAEYEKNATEKRRLIARAQGLSALSDSRKAIDDIKKLQLAWKDLGPVARDDEQKFWDEFRKHCDAVFVKRDQQHSEHRSALEANKAKALALCEEAEQLSLLEGSELLAAAKKVSVLRDAFDAVGELPKANAREVQSRFERALHAYEQRIAAQRARDKVQAWNVVLAAGNKIREYRLALMQQPTAECEDRKQAALAFFDSVEHWPKGVLPQLKNELAADYSRDLTRNENTLRTLCVRAEILTGTATPEHDQAFRRAYQLQRLTQGLGGASDTLDGLILEWVAAGPVGDEAYAKLLERFEKARAAMQRTER